MSNRIFGAVEGCNHKTMSCIQCVGEELAELRQQLAEQKAVARLHAENQRLREYIDILSETTSWFIIASGFPRTEDIEAGIGKERYARMCELKAELFPEGKK